MEFFLNVVLS